MKTKLKRAISVLLSCTVLVFSCIFIPHQKAEASLLLVGGVALGTAVAIGLIAYGIGVSSDDPAEDEYLDMACDKLTEYAAGQGINKWNLNHYLTNATWFWTAMAEVASWFYEQNLVFNEVYETTIEHSYLLDRTAAYFSITPDSSIDVSVVVGDATYSFSAATSKDFQDIYFFYDSIGEVYIVSNTYSRANVSDHIKLSCYGAPPDNGRYFLYKLYEKYNGLYYDNLDEFFSDNCSISAHQFLSLFGINLTTQAAEGYTVENFIDSLVIGEVAPSPGISADFPQRLFTSPADVLDSTGSLDSYKLDPMNDVIDFGNVLEKTGAESFPDLIGKVNTGEITGADVITGAEAVPYVLTDAETGEIATADTPAENVRPVALTGDLSIPQDIAAEDTYTPNNTSTDTDKPKNRFNFPLSDFFPFCLPFDLYDFLTFFVADPVAPVFELDLSTMFSADPDIYDPESDYSITIDLSKFDEVAELLRIIETIGIIVGFVMVSRKLIHGGN